jgi:predicted transcriptional regulator
MARNLIVVDPEERVDILRGLASPLRIKILKLLHNSGPLNVNDIASRLSLPQSTVSSNVQILEDAGLMGSEIHKARKGNQKICRSLFDEVLVAFPEKTESAGKDAISVAMPVGLYTRCEVSAPCGLCSTEAIIGLLDVPDSFLDPDRMKAALIWFTRGFVEYQFPNNARLSNSEIEAIEFSMELSSEMPGTSAEWPSDITLWANGKEAGTWTSPGDFGDRRGLHTPDWWKLKGSQYGKLKTWRIGSNGTFVDGIRISDITLNDLDIPNHHSIRMRIGIRDDAVHPGGINVFGRGFGNYDQDIVLRLYLKK